MLYYEVVAAGGVRHVVSQKLWKPVARALGLPASCTDYGYRLRKHYEKYLTIVEDRHPQDVVIVQMALGAGSQRGRKKARPSAASVASSALTMGGRRPWPSY
jgi:hypothetical protein